jgi:Fe-Mn family superoxide dismutase
MKHMLPSLPYDHAALEPHIDAKTMMLHHDKHHASYVENLNATLEGIPELQERNALWLLVNLNKVPQKIRTAVHNNAGGHVNHSLFWRAMSPAARGAPTGPLGDALDRDFGGLDEF